MLAAIQLPHVHRLMVGQPCWSCQQVSSCGRYSTIRKVLNKKKLSATREAPASATQGAPALAQAEI